MGDSMLLMRRVSNGALRMKVQTSRLLECLLHP